MRQTRMQEDHQEIKMAKQARKKPIMIFKKSSHHTIIKERKQLLFDLDCGIYSIRNKKKS